MRKQMERALKKYLYDQGDRNVYGNCSARTDGVYYFETCLLTRREEDGRRIINDTDYSISTRRHQNTLQGMFPNAIIVDELPRGATGDALRSAAKKLSEEKKGKRAFRVFRMETRVYKAFYTVHAFDEEDAKKRLAEGDSTFEQAKYVETTDSEIESVEPA